MTRTTYPTPAWNRPISVEEHARRQASRARAGQPRHWTTKPAPEAYADRHALATALIARIQETVAEMGERAADEGARLHWGHVGDMAETVRALQQISDRIHAEGEYAPENRA